MSSVSSRTFLEGRRVELRNATSRTRTAVPRQRIVLEIDCLEPGFPGTGLAQTDAGLRNEHRPCLQFAPYGDEQGKTHQQRRQPCGGLRSILSAREIPATRPKFAFEGRQPPIKIPVMISRFRAICAPSLPRSLRSMPRPLCFPRLSDPLRCKPRLPAATASAQHGRTIRPTRRSS